ncbi:PAS domain S-box protein [Alloacidobacterium dinghuense]|uniref:histidine kinase n=1 Tax=Alloacidobacterium dinghuense TaxID=2763107 RepID=A0A7G8BNE6_9BACT|nr:PAS domain-containing sensor histidine kinase [Alloacidobacterium dinghuense]QNI34066.1 PAS domain S-box protein [Alloacidobacterium dinghuense]
MDLFEKNPNPMWIYDSETLRFLDVNQSAIDQYGWSREEFLSMTILDIRPEADFELVRLSAKQSGSQSSSGPWRHLHKDGSEHFVRISSFPAEHASRPARAVIVNNVTDLMRTTEALTQSEEMFRGLCASSPAGVYKSRIDGYVVYVNPVLAKTWQMTEEEMLGHGWQKRVHPDDMESLAQGWLRTNTTGESYEHVFRIVLPSGEIRWIHGRSAPVRNAEGKPIASIGTTDDITEQRGAEDALRMSEAGLRALTDQLPVALLYVDAQGKCRRANRAFEEWFNISREEILSLDFEYFVLRGDGTQYEADVRRAWSQVLQGVPVRFEKSIVVHGRKRTIEATYTPDIDTDGRIPGFIVLLHDITERRALEDQFRHAQKMEAIGRLAGGIAHDFNNILSIMNGYARIIEQELDGTGRLGQMSAEIHRAGERAARLTQQLLAFSRKQVSQPRIALVDDLLRDDETMLRRLVSDAVFLEMIPSAPDACIEIDPHRFSQVLLNLVVNARDAMAQGGTLTIRTTTNRRNVLVSVQDTGCGMPVEVKERLFEPFFTTKEEGKGTGLGLATAYGIVREAGGSIAVESAEGVGSVFTLSIPIARKTQPSDTASRKPDCPKGGCETILLIEDDSNIRYLLAHTLESCGYRVVQAENGLEGLNIAKEMLPAIDAVISDAIMPKMSGQEVIANLRRLRPELKALLVSGHIDADPRDVTGDPLTGFLYKPVPPDILRAELRRLLDGAPPTQSEQAV